MTLSGIQGLILGKKFPLTNPLKYGSIDSIEYSLDDAFSTGGLMKPIITVEDLERKIYMIRGQKIMLDSDLSELYGVTAKRLNEQVRRNAERFPEDFMFQLSSGEFEFLRSHFATLKQGRGQHRKYLPYAFTEHGALMAASVLNTPRAVEVSLYVVRAFVKLRELIASHKDLARKLDELEKKYDGQSHVVFEAIRRLLAIEERPKRKIGFEVREARARYGTAFRRIHEIPHYSANYRA
jgi:phage regulator Rha-like protein